jgi:hypothetical protein
MEKNNLTTLQKNLNQNFINNEYDEIESKINLIKIYFINR